MKILIKAKKPEPIVPENGECGQISHKTPAPAPKPEAPPTVQQAVESNVENSDTPRYLTREEKLKFSQTTLSPAWLKHCPDDFEVLWMGGKTFLFHRSWTNSVQEVTPSNQLQGVEC